MLPSIPIIYCRYLKIHVVCGIFKMFIDGEMFVEKMHIGRGDIIGGVLFDVRECTHGVNKNHGMVLPVGHHVLQHLPFFADVVSLEDVRRIWEMLGIP